jgi:hypothetical protein
MKILQVKIYNETVAQEKYNNAKANSPRSMFFFSLMDKKGYPTTDRQRGYVAYDGYRAVFGTTPQKAKNKLIW